MMKKQAMKKSNKRLQVAWALVKMQDALYNDGNIPSCIDLMPYYTIAKANDLAMIEIEKTPYYDFTFSGINGVYADEIKTGRYYFIPKEAWEAAFSIDWDSASECECMARRAAIMQYATPATFDAWREAWS